jgi:hypothetical protein
MAIDRNATAKETSRGEVKAVNPKDIHLGLAASTGASTGWCSRLQAKGDFIGALDLLDNAAQSHHGARDGDHPSDVPDKMPAAFCASRPELRTADLFSLAERMEAWVGR